jgi:hypothetical protein
VKASTYTRGSLTQRFVEVDLDEDSNLAEILLRWLPPTVDLVYSDPPWNPGNATYWRTYAKLGACRSYASFLDRLVAIYVACQHRGARHVLVEQSSNPAHHGMLLDAVHRHPEWMLPLQRVYDVLYAKPQRPNALLHFGREPLSTDPTGLASEPMTLRSLSGARPEPGTWIVDPCMGLGMTSRMAHGLGLNCFGCELNPQRLARTTAWLVKQGYSLEDA